MHTNTLIFQIVLLGLGATAVMDVWLLAIKRMGVPVQNFALVGRWVGHLPQGRWFHPAIAKSTPVKWEGALGWLCHYTVGIVFAVLLVLIQGTQWLTHPNPLPALSFGMASVLVPWLVVQPAMGAGIASSKTPNPIKNCLRNFINHTVFGFGLYATALICLK